MKIAVIGLGYVGLSNAVLLAQHNRVIAADIDPVRVAQVAQGLSPIEDPDLGGYLAGSALDLQTTTDSGAACVDADFIIVATPSNYDPDENAFDTSAVRSVIKQAIKANQTATLIVKSTVPVGFVEAMRAEFNTGRIIFSPEFLREGSALHDNLYPSRIVVGDTTPAAKEFAALMQQGAKARNIPVLFTSPPEAEAIKLFANTYLAMRIAFFNELDSYAMLHGLDSTNIIQGIGFDPRIGDHYNNPSFGYGGYCLPKDTKQLRANYDSVPQNLMGAIVDANATRKALMADQILARGPKVVGIYRLVMKSGSDNFRDSSVLDVMAHLRAAGVALMVYEPALEVAEFQGAEVVTDFDDFARRADMIVANRTSEQLRGQGAKLFTRDLFGAD